MTGKVVVITGGGSGIGQACVLRCLRDGASVVMASLSQENADATVALAAAEGLADRLASLRGNIADEDHFVALIKLAIDRFGGFDAMLNNAGALGATAEIDEIEAADWDRDMALLLRAPLLGTKHAVRAFRDRGQPGAIVNVASIAGLTAGAGTLAYSTAKAGVVSLTKLAAVQAAKYHVRVNCISPGLILTGMTAFAPHEAADAAYGTMQPWPIRGRSEDIAGGFAYLISDDAAFVTGHNLVIDGAVTTLIPLRDKVRSWAASLQDGSNG